MLKHGCDSACLRGRSIAYKVPHLELRNIAGPEALQPVNIFKAQTGARCFYTHLHYNTLPTAVHSAAIKVPYRIM